MFLFGIVHQIQNLLLKSFDDLGTTSVEDTLAAMQFPIDLTTMR